MTPPTLHYRWVVFRRWIMPGSAVLIGLTLVALVIGGNQAAAASPAVPPDTLAPPSLPALAPARLTPTAQISASTCPLDVVVVMDRSGSMDYDTICFNCFERTEPDQLSNPHYVQYPENGVRYPVVSNTVTSNLCLANPGDGVEPILYNSYRYQILEAELYSLNSSTWERRFRTTGRGYWAINRYWTDTWKVPKPIDPTSGEQTAPGAVSHHPFVTFTDNTPSSPLFGRFYTLADAQNGIAPRLEYDFALPAAWSGNTAYIWIRARQGELPGWSKDIYGTTNPDAVYWGVDSSAVFNGDNIGVGTGWTWVRLGSVSGLAKGDAPYTWHTLKIWAGSPGYTIDRIIITDNWGASLPNQITSSPSQANAQFDTSGGRRNWTTPGSARRQACDPCNPIFGLNITNPRLQTEGGQCLGYYPLLEPTDNLANELFSDVQPIRGSKEAIKNFVSRMDPEFDQVGFITYNDTAAKGSELTCLRRYGLDCYQGSSSWGWPGGPMPYTYTVVLNSIEDQWATNSTCTACGLQAGLEVLGINVDNRPGVDNDCDGSANSACGRGAARRMMILLTDGVPNVNPGGVCDDDPNLWPNGGAPYDCSIYYAQKAAERGVVIYPIGLGFGVDVEFLQAVALETSGQYYFAVSAEDLDLVFDEIISTTTASCSPPNLILAKSATPAEGLGVGDIITYSLSFSNSGDLAATNVVLTDRLPINTQFVTASGSFTPPAPMPGDMITWNFTELIGRTTGTQQLALVISPTQPGELITNVAAIRGKDIDDVYVSAQAILTTPFRLPPLDEFHPIYLPIILKR